MASIAVINAVAARLAAEWHACPVVDSDRPDTPPPDGSAFLAVEYPLPGSGRQMSIGAPGNNVWRETGGIRFLISVPQQDGKIPGIVLADQLAALFRGRNFDGVQTDAPGPPVVDRSRTSGNYIVVAFVVPYQFDLIG